jgi:hypothetical protein
VPFGHPLKHRVGSGQRVVLDFRLDNSAESPLIPRNTSQIVAHLSDNLGGECSEADQREAYVSLVVA